MVGIAYAGTYYDDDWVRKQRLDLAPYLDALETFLERGAFPAAGFGT
jgi:cysteine synthase A